MSDPTVVPPSGDPKPAQSPVPERDQEDLILEPVELNAPLHNVLVWSGIGILLVLLLASIFTWDISVVESDLVMVHVGPSVLYLTFLLVLLSLKKVRVDELGGSECYGQPLRLLKPGLKLVPVFLMQLTKALAQKQQFQCPGEPEQIQKGDDKIALRPGMVRPIRVVTAEGSGGDDLLDRRMTHDLLDRRMTLEVSFAVEYVISNLFEYRRSFGADALQAERELRKQLRDMCEMLVAEEASRRTTSVFLRDIKDMNTYIDDRVKKRFLNTGVAIFAVRMMAPDISHDVSEELANTAKTTARGDQTRIDADAALYATQQEAVGKEALLTAEGKGKANAKLADLNAEAEGTKAKMTALDITDGKDMLAAEVAEVAAQNAHLVLGLSNGTADSLGFFKALDTVRNSQQPATT
jgi:regulator of protease activity HflC (stomatin/prohibitin superfamily)